MPRKDPDADTAYLDALEALQLALVETQTWLIATGAKVLVIFEGRDAAGKDGAIKAMAAHMSARNTRLVALPKPSDRERQQWFLQRYAAHLPAGGEVVVFNRSWYNRAGVEPVMGFCTPEENEEFLRDVVPFEGMLADAGIVIVKFWLDISRAEQRQRLKERAGDPLKALKVSPLDAKADEKWDAYTAARDTMLSRTGSDWAPWTVVRADSKKKARLAILAHLVRTLGCPDLTRPVDPPAPDILFGFEPAALSDGRLQR